MTLKERAQKAIANMDVQLQQLTQQMQALAQEHAAITKARKEWQESLDAETAATKPATKRTVPRKK